MEGPETIEDMKCRLDAGIRALNDGIAVSPSDRDDALESLRQRPWITSLQVKYLVELRRNIIRKLLTKEFPRYKGKYCCVYNGSYVRSFDDEAAARAVLTEYPTSQIAYVYGDEDAVLLTFFT